MVPPVIYLKTPDVKTARSPRKIPLCIGQSLLLGGKPETCPLHIDRPGPRINTPSDLFAGFGERNGQQNIPWHPDLG